MTDGPPSADPGEASTGTLLFDVPRDVIPDRIGLRSLAPESFLAELVYFDLRVE